MNPEPLFRAERLELRYGERLALALESLEIREGERVALLGPNGSGKTSLLKALNGLLKPSSGALRYRGVPASDSAELRRESVYLHQQPYILAGSISYNVEFGCRARGLDRREARARALRSLELLGLSGFDQRHHRALSGGEAQRVALARALAPGPSVLLLDEPTASADAASAERILEALIAASAEGATVIFSTHDPAVRAALALREVVLGGAGTSPRSSHAD